MLISFTDRVTSYGVISSQIRSVTDANMTSHLTSYSTRLQASAVV
jgi:hypothetical protein